MELIVERDEIYNPIVQPYRVAQVNERYEIWYFKDEEVPPISVERYTYTAIPKCFEPCASEALEVSGILALQRQPNLRLSGNGVYIGIVDSGINLWDSAFRNEDGSTRVAMLWDQETDSIYTQQDINDLLIEGEKNEVSNEESRLPGDSTGHGTFIASLAAGSLDVENDFVGAAPDASLLVVKLKDASAALKSFYFIPQSKVVYSEADVMLGIALIEKYIEEETPLSPLALCIGLGCNNGSHLGALPLSQYLDSIAILRNRAVVVPSGNEGIRQHHYMGRVGTIYNQADEGTMSSYVEINVEKDMRGFYVECWSGAPERVVVRIISPSGEVRPSYANLDNVSQSFRFNLEGTDVTIDYRDVGRRNRDQLIFIRFSNAVKGIWAIEVSPQYSIEGSFDMWLPMEGLLESSVYFLAPNPYITLTSPGDSALTMCVGGYSSITGGVYLESGRGFLPDGIVKPDYIAPCATVSGKGLRDDYVTYSGTSVAAAIAVGACAQLLQWAVVEGNATGINSVDIKNLIIRGANRLQGLDYPSELAGYGRLEIYQSFQQI